MCKHLWLIIASAGLLSCTGPKKGNTDFNFSHSYIKDSLPWGWSSAVQSLADYDNDGDLDMTIGAKGSHLFLMQNNGGRWQSSEIGEVPVTSLGTASIDVDKDGWVDLISASVWYKNKQNGEFSMHTYDSLYTDAKQSQEELEVHDIVATDINDDGKMDIVVAGENYGFFWFNTSPIPGTTWEKIIIDPDHTSYDPKVHGGFSPGGIGDLDGDGDKDIFMAVNWFENVDRGKIWIKHPLEFPELFTGELPYGKSTRSVVIDIDNDGDNDIVLSECDDIHARVAILENLSGNGTKWGITLLPQNTGGVRSSFHALHIADFNLDGYLDIIVADQEAMMGKDSLILKPKWFVYTNIGDGWKEQVLLDIGLGGHDIIAGDIDGDGDLDISSKVWGRWDGSANGGKLHVDFIENHTID